MSRESDLTDAQSRLYEYMSDLSEDYYCAGWMLGSEYEFWAMVQGGDRNWGLGTITPDEIVRLKRLSDACEGWIVWHHDDDPMLSGPLFVPMSEWPQRYRTELERMEAQR